MANMAKAIGAANMEQDLEEYTAAEDSEGK